MHPLTYTFTAHNTMPGSPVRPSSPLLLGKETVAAATNLSNTLASHATYESVTIGGYPPLEDGFDVETLKGDTANFYMQVPNTH